MDNLDASVVILKKLSDELKVHSIKHSTLDPVRETLKLFRQKVINLTSLIPGLLYFIVGNCIVLVSTVVRFLGAYIC